MDSLSLQENINRIKPSATLVINERSNALSRQGKNIYKLGFGQSPFPVPPEVVQSLKNNAHQKDYLPVRGLQELRKAVAGYHQRSFGTHFTEEDILIGPGSKELLFLIQMVFSGHLLIPQPSWVSYEPQAHLANKKYKWIHTHEENGYLLEAKALDLVCSNDKSSRHILILNYPSNPCGSTFDINKLQELAEVSRKHNLLIVSDEIYGDVDHNGHHQSMAKFYPEGTIVSTGLSKWCGAGGWRLGSFAFPKQYDWLLEKMAIVASETYTTTSAPVQFAAVKAFSGSDAIQDYLNKSRTILKRIAEACSKRLLENNITHPQPEGGFYLMPNFNYYKKSLRNKSIKTSFEFCEALLEETGVALLPLSAFGMEEEFIRARLSYVDFDGDRAMRLLESDTNASAESLAPKVMEGITRMIDWIRN